MSTATKPLDWRYFTACRPGDLEFFFGPERESASDRHRREEKALLICRHCPVRHPCGEWAVRHREPWGVWGGLTERDRLHPGQPAGEFPLCGNKEHEMTPDNTYVYPNGVKGCRACRAANHQRRREQRREGRAA